MIGFNKIVNAVLSSAYRDLFTGPPKFYIAEQPDRIKITWNPFFMDKATTTKLKNWCTVNYKNSERYFADFDKGVVVLFEPKDADLFILQWM